MKNPSSYLKMRVLGAIEGAPGKNQQERVEHVAGMVFLDEMGENRRFTWRTIYTWWYRYKHHGVTGISKNTRSDKGRARKVTPEMLQEVLNQTLPHFKPGRQNRTAIYRKAIELGLVRPEDLSHTSYFRFLKEYDLLKDDSNNRLRLAFAMQHANQLWQGDTMFGPHVRETGRMAAGQVKLIAFIDDASRVVCHGEFYWQDSGDMVNRALRSAVYKRGVPEQLYLDNGKPYKTKEIILICARLGIVLCHTPVRDGAAKGKIERFFRTVRDCFLTQNLDLSSLAALNKQFFAWLEDDYNHKVHSGIGMKPIDRFGLDRARIRYLPNLQANDELFFCEDERTVLANNTFSFNAATYEAPSLLRGRRIQIRFDRYRHDSPVIVYFKGERQGEAKPVDLVANGLLRRTAILARAGKGEQKVVEASETRVGYRPPEPVVEAAADAIPLATEAPDSPPFYPQSPETGLAPQEVAL